MKTNFTGKQADVAVHRHAPYIHAINYAAACFRLHHGRKKIKLVSTNPSAGQSKSSFAQPSDKDGSTL